MSQAGYGPASEASHSTINGRFRRLLATAYLQYIVLKRLKSSEHLSCYGKIVISFSLSILSEKQGIHILRSMGTSPEHAVAPFYLLERHFTQRLQSLRVGHDHTTTFTVPQDAYFWDRWDRLLHLMSSFSLWEHGAGVGRSDDRGQLASFLQLLYCPSKYWKASASFSTSTVFSLSSFTTLNEFPASFKADKHLFPQKKFVTAKDKNSGARCTEHNAGELTDAIVVASEDELCIRLRNDLFSHIYSTLQNAQSISSLVALLTPRDETRLVLANRKRRDPLTFDTSRRLTPGGCRCGDPWRQVLQWISLRNI